LAITVTHMSRLLYFFADFSLLTEPRCLNDHHMHIRSSAAVTINYRCQKIYNMKLSGIGLVYAVWGSSSSDVTTALTAIDPLQEQECELKKRKTGGRGSDTKSGKAADPNVDNPALDYPATARTIVDYMGCNNDHNACGHACFTVDGEDAVEALKKIASGAGSAVLFATHFAFGLGICDSDLKCQALNPADDERKHEEDINFFKDVQETCGGDAYSLTELKVVFGELNSKRLPILIATFILLLKYLCPPL
jgi:hypothetical protein